jgi:hypothetical protein
LLPCLGLRNISFVWIVFAMRAPRCAFAAKRYTEVYVSAGFARVRYEHYLHMKK